MSVKKASLMMLLFAIICVGCDKKSNPGQEGKPESKELSTVKGVSIRYAENTGFKSWETDSTGEYIAKGVEFKDIVQRLWPEGYIEVEPSKFDGKNFNLIISGTGKPEPEETYWNKFRNAFEQSFDVSIITKKKLVDVKVLSRGTGELKINKVEGRMGSGCGTTMNGIKFESYDFDQVAEVLEGDLKVKVFNETGLDGKYDFEVKADMFEPETYPAGFKEIGLNLSDVKRELDVVVIEKAK